MYVRVTYTQIDAPPTNLDTMRHRLCIALTPFPKTFHELDVHITTQFDLFESVDGLMQLFGERTFCKTHNRTQRLHAHDRRSKSWLPTRIFLSSPSLVLRLVRSPGFVPVRHDA